MASETDVSQSGYLLILCVPFARAKAATRIAEPCQLLQTN
jgi:hypothetical protein